MKSHLQIWKLLLPLVIAIIFFMTYVDPAKLETHIRGQRFKNELNRTHFEDNRIGVLVFGNSLLNYALPSEAIITRSINKEIRRQTGKKRRLDVSKVCVGGLQTQELRKNREKILGLRPQIVMLQSELIIPNRGVRLPPASMNEFVQSKKTQVQRWSIALKFYLIPSIQKIAIPEKTEQLLGSAKAIADVQKQEIRSESAEDNPERILNMWINRKIDLNMPEYLISKELIDSAHKAGIRVVILDTPVSAHISTSGHKVYMERRAAAIQRLLRPDDCYLRFMRVLPNENFYDFHHVLKKGSDLYFSWMVNSFVTQCINLE